MATVKRIGVKGSRHVVLSYLPLVAWEVFPKVVLLLFLSSLLTQIYDTGRLEPGLKNDRNKLKLNSCLQCILIRKGKLVSNKRRVSSYCLECISIECGKTKTRVIKAANQNEGKYHKEPMKTQAKQAIS